MPASQREGRVASVPARILGVCPQLAVWAPVQDKTVMCLVLICLEGDGSSFRLLRAAQMGSKRQVTWWLVVTAQTLSEDQLTTWQVGSHQPGPKEVKKVPLYC